jgi:tRNA G18 (ribose-2'-O)-methylase SpoU
MACADRQLAGDKEIASWPESALLVCCPDTSLPDNLGSIIRLAGSFSASGLITGPRCVDPFSRRCVRVSMGNIFRLDIFQPQDLAGFLTGLKQRFGFEIVAGEQAGHAESLERFSPARRMVLMFGNEAHGLGPEWLGMSDRAVQIEMSPNVDSLNVSTAAAILLYGIRQRMNQSFAKYLTENRSRDTSAL